MIKNKKCDHIGLAVNDIEAATEWYKNVLGFELIGDFLSNHGSPCRFLKNNDIVYEITQPSKGIRPGAEGKIDHFAYQSDDIEKDYEFCKEQGYNIITNGVESIPTFWDNGCKFFKIASPTGEEIEFCQVL